MFTDLEKQVVELLLIGDVLAERGITARTFQQLQQQWKQATLGEREWTGVGFFTSFELPEAVELTSPENLVLGDVAAQIDGFTNEVGFLWFVRDGRVDTLEGYSGEDPGVTWDQQSYVLDIYRTTSY